jgi:hypothetical protein
MIVGKGLECRDFWTVKFQMYPPPQGSFAVKVGLKQGQMDIEMIKRMFTESKRIIKNS